MKLNTREINERVSRFLQYVTFIEGDIRDRKFFVRIRKRETMLRNLYPGQKLSIFTILDANFKKKKKEKMNHRSKRKNIDGDSGR